MCALERKPALIRQDEQMPQLMPLGEIDFVDLVSAAVNQRDVWEIEFSWSAELKGHSVHIFCELTMKQCCAGFPAIRVLSCQLGKVVIAVNFQQSN